MKQDYDKKINGFAALITEEHTFTANGLAFFEARHFSAEF